MSVFRRGEFWWYEFWFAGRRIRESSKSTSKTVALKAEHKRLRELEESFNNVVFAEKSFAGVAELGQRAWPEERGEKGSKPCRERNPQKFKRGMLAISHK